MADSIREQIILAIIARLAIIRTQNGFHTNLGARVERVRRQLAPAELPACVVWPKPETVDRNYKTGQMVMPVQIDGMLLHGTTNPSVQSEQMLADLIEAMVGAVWSLAFTSGGATVVQSGDTITGAASGATAWVQSVRLASGSWAAGTAAGTLTLRRVYGTFQAENLDIGTTANVATIAGAPTATDPVAATTASLAESILYAGGGVDEYPEGSDQVTGVVTTWHIHYRTISGNPYRSQ